VSVLGIKGFTFSDDRMARSSRPPPVLFGESLSLRSLRFESFALHWGIHIPRTPNSTNPNPTLYHVSITPSFEVFMTEPSYDELKARLADLEKQVETKKRSGTMEFKVSEKGGVSVYGLGRFPVTLYYEQWTRLLDASDNLRQFLEDNKSKLKLKGQ
jgi:hypothetical protein